MTQPTHRLTDERLCWLAVRDHCARRSRRRGVLGWLTLLATASRGGGSGRAGTAMVGEEQRDAMTGKMGDYAFAVDDAARTLRPDERAHLRATGEVPDWFLADVERRFIALRR
ncbi:hypothetical protein [Actinocatenispora rupis]|uniref:Uncharacterized protein n=1 Tax=Actinocatenispora rupis TaxID=519421 RepID=A0A8J3N9W5_9ACTN|nr:hypothetical protein [Actinocatenispora rupis]GID11481.1 hypothetical protein Aru02nite_23700 [Actinocatenispora rupis]